MNPKEFAKEWIEAWNSHCLDSILSHYSQDIEFNSPVVRDLLGIESGSISGKENLRGYFKVGLDKYPNLEFELINILEGVKSISLYYKNPLGTYTAEAFEFNSSGKVSRVVASYS